MQVALESFRDPTDQQWITRGLTYVSEDSDVYRLYPKRFEKVSGLGPRSIIRDGGTAMLADSPKRPTRSAPKIRFRERSAFGYTVSLGPGVRAEIEDEVSWCRHNGGGFPDHEVRETGGYLYSLVRPGLDEVTIHLASGPGPDSLHGYDALRMSRVEDVEEQLFATRPRHLFHRCGCWHSHPVPDDEPSPTDMQSWVLRSKKTATLSYCSLIVTPKESGGWMYPKISAFQTFGDGAGYVCERARVIE
jgi:hypothetical protein